MEFPALDENGNLHMLTEADVSCIRRDGATRRIILGTGYEDYEAPRTLNQIAQIMEPYGFVRIDKNKIVNIARIDKYENGVLTLGNTRFTVSRRHKPALESAIENRSRNTNG